MHWNCDQLPVARFTIFNFKKWFVWWVADLPNTDLCAICLLSGLLISAAPLCNNANVINSTKYNDCYSTDKQLLLDHVAYCEVR